MKRLYLVVASVAALLCSCDGTTNGLSPSVLTAVAQAYGTPTPGTLAKSSDYAYIYGTHITETMIDRCSSDVFISSYYDYVNGLMLSRGSESNAYTEWSDQMPVKGHSWIRWFCHSTTGNFLDPGTWRIRGTTVGVNCTGPWDSAKCEPAGSIDLGSSAIAGWTPERSRCDSSNTKAISARLGPGRLLEMRCIE